MDKSDTKKSRRDFIRFFLFGSLTAWAGAAFFMVARFLSPVRSSKSKLPQFVDIGKSAGDIPKNSSFVFPFGNRPAMLIREKSGKLVAFFATCPHLGCTVQYNPLSNQIICNCHDGIFDLEGKKVSGPPKKPLIPLAVRIISKDKIRLLRAKA